MRSNLFMVFFVIFVFAACTEAHATLPECKTVPHYFVGVVASKVQYQSAAATAPIVSQIHNNRAACEKAITEQIGMLGIPALTGNVIPAVTASFNGVCHATKECVVTSAP